MGKIGNEPSLIQQFGGINEKISTLQKDSIEFDDCLNVYLMRYGKYGAVCKRKGLQLMNAGTQADGSIKKLYTLFLNNTVYAYAFTANGTLYGINVSTGALTSLATSISTTSIPTMAVVNNVLFICTPTDDTNISTCEATTGWTETGAGSVAPVLSNVRYKGQSSIKIQVNAAGALLSGAEFAPASALNLTAKTFELQFAAGKTINTTHRARTANVATLTVASTNGLTVNSFVVISSVGGTGYNSANAVKVKSVTATKITYDNVGADEAEAADATGRILMAVFPSTITKYRISLYTAANYTYWEGTKAATGNQFVTFPGFNCLRLPVDLATKTGDDGTGCTINNISKIRLELYTSAAASYSLYIDNLLYYNTTGGIRSSVDGVTFTGLSNPYAPRAKRIVEFDNKLFGVDDSNVYWSNLGDGMGWYPFSSVFDRDSSGIVDVDLSASSTPVNQGDGDVITAVRVLGRQLVIFKRHGIFRFEATNGDPQYRIVPQLSGKTGEGIGCSSHEAVCNAVLENMYSDVYGKAEYLIFPSDRGIHALGIVGNPLDIHDRIFKTLQGIPTQWLATASACIDIRSDLYIMTYATNRQLVFALNAKGWTKYGFNGATALATIVDGDNKYIFLGNSSGWIYKHNATDPDYYSDYNDNANAYTSFVNTKTNLFGNGSRQTLINGLTVLTEDMGTSSYSVYATLDGITSNPTTASTSQVMGGKSVQTILVYEESVANMFTASDGLTYILTNNYTDDVARVYRMYATGNIEQVGQTIPTGPGFLTAALCFVGGELYVRPTGSANLYQYIKSTGLWTVIRADVPASDVRWEEYLYTNGTYLYAVKRITGTTTTEIYRCTPPAGDWGLYLTLANLDCQGSYASAGDIYFVTCPFDAAGQASVYKNNALHSNTGFNCVQRSIGLHGGNYLAIASTVLYGVFKDTGTGFNGLYSYDEAAWVLVSNFTPSDDKFGRVLLETINSDIYILRTTVYGGNQFTATMADKYSGGVLSNITDATYTTAERLSFLTQINTVPIVLTGKTGHIRQYRDASWEDYLGGQFRETTFNVKGYASYIGLRFAHATKNQGWKLLGYLPNIKKTRHKLGA